MTAPRITKFLPQVVMNSSQDVELVCAVAGSPLPDVVWSRDGQRLGSCANKLPSLRKACSRLGMDSHYTFSLTGSGSRLLIENAFAQFDAGEFTCTVVSPLGRREANATLTLRGEELTMSTQTRIYSVERRGRNWIMLIFIHISIHSSIPPSNNPSILPSIVPSFRLSTGPHILSSILSFIHSFIHSFTVVPCSNRWLKTGAEKRMCEVLLVSIVPDLKI